MNNQHSQATRLDLYDWRRRVAAMYQERERSLSAGRAAAEVLGHFRDQKDKLCADHPQTPLDSSALSAFKGLHYFPYNPDMRVIATVTPEQPHKEIEETQADSGRAFPLERAATLHFALGGAPQQLSVYWIDVYGGGLFLPFLDATCPAESYGGGRYLFDTAKGSDFLTVDADPSRHGWSANRIELDFNYAYNPSCAYDARWVCPLSPRENRLQIEIRAGEKKFYE